MINQVSAVSNGLLFETTGDIIIKSTWTYPHAKMKNDKASATTNIRRRATAGEIPLPIPRRIEINLPRTNEQYEEL